MIGLVVKAMALWQVGSISCRLHIKTSFPGVADTLLNNPQLAVNPVYVR